MKGSMQSLIFKQFKIFWSLKKSSLTLIFALSTFIFTDASYGNGIGPSFDQNLENMEIERRLLLLEDDVSADDTSSTIYLNRLSPATDNTIAMGDGSHITLITMPNCTSGMIRFNQTTNTFTCGAVNENAWEIVENGDMSDIDSTDASYRYYTITETLAEGYVYKLYIEGYMNSGSGSMYSATALIVKTGSDTFTSGTGGKIFETDGIYMVNGSKLPFKLDAEIWYGANFNDEDLDARKTPIEWNCYGQVDATTTIARVVGVGNFPNQITSIGIRVQVASTEILGKYYLMRTKQ
jgi:hypothetical protein